MRTLSLILALLAVAAAVPAGAASTLLIHDATVHTLTAAGTLEHTDVLVRDGKIAAIGPGVAAPAGATVIEAAGHPVTPGLFGGLSALGIQEIGQEPPADDNAQRLGMRPEFDVSLAFTPQTAILGVSRLGGITFAMVAPSAAGGRNGGGSIIAGQGAVALLDGTVTASHALFVAMGGAANSLSGGSRAAQFMLLEQAITEVRSPTLLQPGDQRLLTPAGRQALASYLAGNKPVVVSVERASDIRRVLAFAQREKLRVVISGGDEAWQVAGELAAAKVPVILNPLDDLPDSFDSVGSTLENAALLARAGVKIAFKLDAEPYNIRKVRQAAGVAVAHGLPWDAALAALTRNPAEIFGVADRAGSLAVGRIADLVLWSGDPLDVTSLADRVIIAGADQPMHSRQTELRDRYLAKLKANQAR
jgi:imidazolonepropionase-like amidohydrolase